MSSEQTVDAESTVYSSERQGPPDLRILHYNDVYHIEAGSAEPVGGIARFQTTVNEYRSESKYAGQSSLLTFFSGDAFNPSLESSVTKGRHMVPFLNGIGTDVACVGNHDLDFGIAQFRHLRNQCSFPWLLANVLDPALGEGVALANCEKTVILTSSTGIKIGVIGLAEREWLDTVNALPPNLIYKSASTTAKELVPALRAQGAEFIIALTHMREPNDIKLAEKTPPGLIDLVLGGHDHYYAHHPINSTHVLRSGSDFKQLSYIEAWRKGDGSSKWDVSITRRDIVRSTLEDTPTLELTSRLTSDLREKLEKAIGYTAAPLDGRFTTVRTRESNLGNFVCDLMRFYYSTDCALMASGTIRGDQIYPPGVLRLKDIMNCFPFEDPVVVLRVSGRALMDALENAVSLVPALEGRYPQVSNITFEYHASAPAGSRVTWVKLNDELLDFARSYTLATRGFMARGKDGFASLLAKSEGGEAEEIVSEENGVLISTILRQYFLSLKVVGKWRRWGNGLHRHWGGVHDKLHQGGNIKEPGSPKATTPVTGPISNPLHAPLRPAKHGRNGSLKVHHAHSNAHIHAHAHAHRPHHSHHAKHDNSHKASSETQLVDTDSESDVEIQSSPITPLSKKPYQQEEEDRNLHLARSVAKKWMRLAGVHRSKVDTVDDADEEFMPHWTKGIAPRLEGRIRVVGRYSIILPNANPEMRKVSGNAVVENG